MECPLSEDDFEIIEANAAKAFRAWERKYYCQDINIRHSINWWIMKATEEYLNTLHR